LNFETKAGIIRTETTFEGMLAKGVGTDFNWSVFEEYLVDGTIPDFKGDLTNEALISRLKANLLQLNVGDSFFTYCSRYKYDNRFIGIDFGTYSNDRGFKGFGFSKLEYQKSLFIQCGIFDRNRIVMG